MTRGTRAASDGETIRVPASLVAAGPPIEEFFDPAFAPMRSRVRALVEEQAVDGDALVPMATMVTARDGGGLRTFSGGLAHENGWLACRIARRLVHFEGVAQRALIVRAISEHPFVRLSTESRRLEFSDGVEKYRHTIDVELTRADGSLLLVEMKRDEGDLRDPHLRRTLAGAAEIYRRCGMDFVIVFRDEVFRDRRHRVNCELVASRQFLRIDRRHLVRLEGHASRHGRSTTYGALSESLEPSSRVHGDALVQALVTRRRVEMDVSRRLTRDTGLLIH